MYKSLGSIPQSHRRDRRRGEGGRERRGGRKKKKEQEEKRKERKEWGRERGRQEGRRESAAVPSSPTGSSFSPLSPPVFELDPEDSAFSPAPAWGLLHSLIVGLPRLPLVVKLPPDQAGLDTNCHGLSLALKL